MSGKTKKLLNKYLNKTCTPPENYVKVGMNTCGISAGAEGVYKALLTEVLEKGLPVEINKVGCIGMCFAEPVIEVKIGDKVPVLYQKVDKKTALGILESELQDKGAFQELIVQENPLQKKIVLKNCGKIDPEKIEDYLENGGYQAVNKVFSEMNSGSIIEEVRISGLRGRGGAGYPTWKKWTNAKQAADGGQKYIICNGDEGDPGAYMDRSVLEGDPHAVIEGMIIAGFTIGATKGYFYIRAEYPLAVKRVNIAIKQAYDNGLLGKNILDSGFDFDLEVRLGAGAFVCGEETALIASIEGKRGYPSPRPPYPAIKGLWGNPTVINNVETLANVPYIILNGGESIANIGIGESTGTKVFALTGKVKNSGLAEVPMGTTLRQVIEEIGDGVANNKRFKAVQTGGPSGGIIPEKYLDTPISYETLEKLGSIMGSGGMIVMDEDDCIVDIARFFMKFCVDESCGKCSPCRIGTAQAFNILDKISKCEADEEDIQLLIQLCHTMREASLCGLGQTASNPVLSSLKYFEHEYIEHITENKCCSGRCNGGNRQ